MFDGVDVSQATPTIQRRQPAIDFLIYFFKSSESSAVKNKKVQ
jgi:hypothetical protein